MTKPESRDGTQIVKDFFQAFASGDVDAVIGAFDADAEITAVRSGPRAQGQLYGQYSGPAGVRDFLATLGGLLHTQEFATDVVVGSGDIVFASGTFLHLVKSTGKPFRSAWALRCDVRDGKIWRYRFFEDSAAYVEASAL